MSEKSFTEVSIRPEVSSDIELLLTQAKQLCLNAGTAFYAVYVTESDQEHTEHKSFVSHDGRFKEDIIARILLLNNGYQVRGVVDPRQLDIIIPEKVEVID